MKKRREILQAMREDSRISSLEGNVQRLSSEVEAYRRFSDRTGTLEAGNKNQIEQLQHLLLEEQEKNKQLAAELNVFKLRLETEKSSIVALEASHKDDLAELNHELTAARTIIAEMERENIMNRGLEGKQNEDDKGDITDEGMTSARTTNLGPASLATIQQQEKLKNELRLAQISIKQLERNLERETRRADRAQNEYDELASHLDSLKREQNVKDSQLDAMRTELQDMLTMAAVPQSRPSTAKSAMSAKEESKQEQLLEGKHEEQKDYDDDDDNDEEEEEYEDVLAIELEQMRQSYENKVQTLTEQLDQAKKHIKELNSEIGSLKAFKT